MFGLDSLLWHPERIAVIAGLFLLGYLALRWSGRYRAWPMLVAAIAWGVLVPYEWQNKATGANIRIDLFLLVPLMAAISAWAIGAAFWSRSPKES